MKKTTKLLGLITLTTLCASMPAQAKTSYTLEANTPAKTQVIIEDFSNTKIVPIPLDLDIEVKKVSVIETNYSKSLNQKPNIKIDYTDVLGELDLNVGVIKNQTVNSPIQSGRLPRGRYFEPRNAKLGAGLFRKF